MKYGPKFLGKSRVILIRSCIHSFNPMAIPRSQCLYILHIPFDSFLQVIYFIVTCLLLPFVEESKLHAYVKFISRTLVLHPFLECDALTWVFDLKRFSWCRICDSFIGQNYCKVLFWITLLIKLYNWTSYNNLYRIRIVLFTNPFLT